jgi:hypothetical protein
VEAEAVPPTEPLNNFLQGTKIVVPSNATRSIEGHVDLGMPSGGVGMLTTPAILCW